MAEANIKKVKLNLETNFRTILMDTKPDIKAVKQETKIGVEMLISGLVNIE